jgi:hypothetical protein
LRPPSRSAGPRPIETAGKSPYDVSGPALSRCSPCGPSSSRPESVDPSESLQLPHRSVHCADVPAASARPLSVPAPIPLWQSRSPLANERARRGALNGVGPCKDLNGVRPRKGWRATTIRRRSGALPRGRLTDKEAVTERTRSRLGPRLNQAARPARRGLVGEPGVPPTLSSPTLSSPTLSSPTLRARRARARSARAGPGSRSGASA